MIAYHVIIAAERRTPLRELATLIDGDQLHSLGYALNNLDDPNILYAAEWDGVAPYVILHKGGSMEGLKMSYAGWPSIDKASYETQQQAAQPAAQSEFDQLEQQAATWPDFSVRW